MILLPFYVDDIIKTALSEDINYIDSTADLLIPENSYSDAYLMAKASAARRSRRGCSRYSTRPLT